MGFKQSKKIINNTLNNYFVMDVKNLTSLNSNGTVKFEYLFKLNTNDQFDSNLLPYFVTDVYTNITGKIMSFDARFDNIFDIILNISGNVLYTFTTDNEIQNLERKTTITKPTDSTDPTDPTNPNETPYNSKDSNNGVNKNNQNVSMAKSSMKKTSLPILVMILVLLTSLGLVYRRNNLNNF
ncbi:hypothetical protein ALNOE001_08470 [Candidatus Methanobinarius endosymbioticus]|uniref:Uncharacterized protein n=1 Tax=Candidatus Methanobinarius endosymbioticus TaxID=2006182 RepID=A0A366MBZ9_9EURY|nr:hypothetical protein ALNOE001_08470 [Candidatus Methanobinarius endosymbioticus]